MDKQIFRKKSLDRISSPEQLNDYIRVANPAVWLILGAVLVLLVGALVWGVFGRLDTTAPACVTSEGGKILCYLNEDDAANAQVGMKVVVGDAEYSVAELSNQAISAEGMDARILHVGGFDETQWLCQATLDGEMDEGVYSAYLILESVSPMSFVAN